MPSLTEPGEPSRSDARLYEVLGSYYDDGDDTDARRSMLVAGHPALADELARYFAKQDRLRQLLQSSSSAHGTTNADPTEANFGDADGPPSESSSLDEYELIDKISAGGMGIVYSARRRGLDRIVALKVLRPDRATASDRIRFQNETQAIGDLDHPNIVPIYDAGPDFFAMKLIPGGSLAESLPRFVRSPREAAQLMVKLARAVQHAHERGILHRDLKPSNVLLDEAGEPYVSDFGLAKRLGLSLELTQIGQVLGTLNYMAPEQATGSAKDVTTRTDIWGLGTILYAILTGRPPFPADSVAVLLVQLQGKDPDRPSSLNPRVNLELEAICLKCLEKEPGKRYATAAALADDLERWLADRPIQARPVGQAERARRWCRRNPTITGLAAAIILLAMTAAAGLVTGLVRIAREQSATKAALRLAQDERETALRHAAEAQARRAWAIRNLRTANNVMQVVAMKVQTRNIADVPEVAELRRSIIALAANGLHGQIDETRVDPAIRHESGIAYIHLANLHFLQGELVQTRRAFQRAIDLFERLAIEFPVDPSYLLEVGQCHNILGLQLRVSGCPREAGEHFGQADRAYCKAFELDPGNTDSIMFVRWFLSTCPDPRFRDPARALKLARIRLADTTFRVDSNDAMELGIALYRTGDLEGAIEALERSMASRSGNSHESFFLAMAYQGRGDRRRALDSYCQAVQWMEANRPRDWELLNFRAEAEGLLGIAGSRVPNGLNGFRNE